MRLISLLLLLGLSAPALADPPLGARTRAPETHLRDLPLGPGQDDMAAAVAAAERNPLGSPANPIRVGGPEGERAYLARLRCPAGAAPQIGPRTDGGIDAYGTVSDRYEVRCAAERFTLVFDPYNEEHVEDRAPSGLTIAPR